MPVIHINGKAYQVPVGRNLLHAALSLGFDLPYFCWHPAMGSVGACRQCAVKQFRDEHDTQGRLVMACMTAAEDGTRISIDDDEARRFRAGVIEWLMVNHPHDCPVCDEGGECHLQDMTVMTGHVYRRCRFKKRTHRNQYLGPFVNHEMNRCIQCYRCVRFYREYADGRDFDVFAAHDHVYFGRHADGVLESPFSGNLVEVCPTGVFTDKTLKSHYTRKWDLQTAPSICVHCGLGCNTIPGERYGVLRRIRNRYNHEVNGYFLCDRGRYGYEFVNSDKRLRRPLLRATAGGTPEAVSPKDALRHLASLLRGGGEVIGIGSPRASLETNFALRRLAGPERFYMGVSPGERALLDTMLRILRDGPARSVSLREAENADAVFVLGEDLTNAAPMLALALRQASRRQPAKEATKLGIPAWHDAALREVMQTRRGPVFIATPQPTPLDDIASGTYRGAPADISRLAFAVAHALDPAAPGDGVESPGAAEIARALKEAEQPLIVAGPGCGSEALLKAAANIAWALPGAGLSFTTPECNTLGCALMGGRDLPEALESIRDGRTGTVIVAENDLVRRGWAEALRAEHVVVIDHMSNATTEQAELLLPAATFAEAAGTLVNSEGRAQRYYQVYVPTGDVQAGWRWLRDAMVEAGSLDAGAWGGIDDVVTAMAAELPALAAAVEVAPPASLKISGEPVPRQAHRYSGRTAMHAGISVHEPQPPGDPDSPLAFSMEGFEGMAPPALVPRYWAPGWNSVQALNKFQDEVAGPLHGGDPGRRLIEPRKTAEVTYFDEIPAAFCRREGKWLVVPLHHIFGSEELSAFSPGVAGLAPEPYIALNPEDAAGMGDIVLLRMDGGKRRLRVKEMPSLPRGLAGVPSGLQALSGLTLPDWGEISREGSNA